MCLFVLWLFRGFSWTDLCNIESCFCLPFHFTLFLFSWVFFENTTLWVTFEGSWWCKEQNVTEGGLKLHGFQMKTIWWYLSGYSSSWLLQSIKKKKTSFPVIQTPRATFGQWAPSVILSSERSCWRESCVTLWSASMT